MKKILILVFLYVSIVKAQNNIFNGGFELSNPLNDFSALTDNLGSNFSCTSYNFINANQINLSNVPINNTQSLISLIQLNQLIDYDPILASLPQPVFLSKVNSMGGVRSIKINPSNALQCGNCTAGDMTSLSRVINISSSVLTNPILSLNFSVVYSMPSNSTDVFTVARFDILDSNFNIINSKCILSNDEDAVGPISGNSIFRGDWRYIDWNCVDLNVCQLINNNEVGYLRITVQDYNKGFDTYMYLDDIGNYGQTCTGYETDCILTPPACFSKLKVNNPQLICPDFPIEISGTIKKDVNTEIQELNLQIQNGFGLAIANSNEYSINQLNSTTFNYAFQIEEEDIDFSSSFGDISIQVTGFFENMDGQLCSTNIARTDEDTPALIFEDCTELCNQISTESFEVASNGLFTWENLSQNNSFIVEFTQNSDCCGPPINSPQTLTFNVETNAFDLFLLQNHFSCGTLRVFDVSCNLWSELCCLSIKPQTDGSVSFNLLRDVGGECIPLEGRFFDIISQNDIVLYPNPFFEYINVHVKNKLDSKIFIKILDFQGNEILPMSKFDSLFLPVEKLNKGLYFIKFYLNYQGKEYEIIKKIMKL